MLGLVHSSGSFMATKTRHQQDRPRPPQHPFQLKIRQRQVRQGLLLK